MNEFNLKIAQLLSAFTPYLTQQAVIFGHIFTKEKATVAEFVAEIKNTVEQLQHQHQTEYVEMYSEKLFRQFEALNKAVRTFAKEKKIEERFHSAYRFPKNVHSLNEDKRLIEYRKALRALNEKISWLVEKQLNAKSQEEFQQWQQQIIETEFRKNNCLKAIEDLEEKTTFKY